VLNFFTYGRHFRDFEEKYDGTKTRSSKHSVRKRKTKASIVKNSRRGSISNYKNFLESAARRNSANFDFSAANNHSKRNTGDTSSDAESNRSILVHEAGSKSSARNKEVVIEEDGEESPTSSKKLSRKSSMKRRNSLTRRNENNKKTSSSLARLLGNKEESRNEGNLIKLWKTATKDTTKREKRNYPSDYLHFDRSERKKNVRLNMKVFENLHEKMLMSSLGAKVAKPEFPKSLYPKTRIHLSKERKRPGTAVLSRKKRNYTTEK
jgi:hypothetical protein